MFRLSTPREDSRDLPDNNKRRTRASARTLDERFIRILKIFKWGPDAEKELEVLKLRVDHRLVREIHDNFNKSTNGVSRTKNMITGKWNRMHPDCQKFHAIYKEITRKSDENDGNVLEAAKAEYSAYHFDSEDHTEIFGPDARPRPPGNTRPAKKTKSETTESSAGSGSGSMKDVLNEELRQKIQAGKSAYEAKKVKEQSATELNDSCNSIHKIYNTIYKTIQKSN
ncbi:hypothetical protein Tco_1420983 [Tanacetum coccineum]